MACLYCGKEVPFRLKLTGEDRFCCQEHMRLYNEEHSRIGLARLMEQVAPVEEAAAPEEAPVIGEAEPKSEVPAVDALPEPKAVASGRGLELWSFGHISFLPEPRFERLGRLEFAPADYAPGSKTGERALAPATSELVKRVLVLSATNQPAAATRISPKAESAARQVSPAMPEREPKAESKPAPAAPPLVERAPKPPAKETAPDISFGGFESAKENREDRSGTTKVAAGVVLAICLGAAGYIGLGIGSSDGGVRSEAAAMAQATGWDEWIPNWSAGEQGEEIALFGPSQEWSDYKVEWDARERDEVAWVYRAIDPENYFVVRLERTAAGTVQMVRYAMIDGARTAEDRAPLGNASTGQTAYAVELEVKGSRFTLYVEGHNVADWTDDRLEGGGFGVIRPDAGLAGVNDVKVTQLDRTSASERGHFWKGTPPERLPEVTLLGQRPPRTLSTAEPVEESTL